MQNPELDVRQIRLVGEDELFFDLASPFLCKDKDEISSYRLRQVVHGCTGEVDRAYAIYEMNHDILAVQFFIDKELLSFGDDESVQFLSVDEVRLIRELGTISIDGTAYSIKNTTYNLIDGAGGCQRMFVFTLTEKH